MNQEIVTENPDKYIRMRCKYFRRSQMILTYNMMLSFGSASN